MAKVTTSKKINLVQLDQELGSQGLCSDENDLANVVITTADNSTVTQAELEDAVKNHEAVFNAPSVADRLSSVGLSIDDLKSALGL